MFAHYYASDAARNVTMCGVVVDPAKVSGTAKTCPMCVKAVQAECQLSTTLTLTGIKHTIKHRHS